MAKRTYVVKAGDNLATLADKLGVTIQELQQTNGIHNLTPGQTLKVPQGLNTQSSAGGYSVSTGDNERKTINYNGTTIRLGPNSTFAPKNEPNKNAFSQFMDVITGRSQAKDHDYGTARAGVADRSLASIPLQNYDNSQFSVNQAQQIGTLNVPNQFSYSPQGQRNSYSQTARAPMNNQYNQPVYDPNVNMQA